MLFCRPDFPLKSHVDFVCVYLRTIGSHLPIFSKVYSGDGDAAQFQEQIEPLLDLPANSDGSAIYRGYVLDVSIFFLYVFTYNSNYTFYKVNYPETIAVCACPNNSSTVGAKSAYYLLLRNFANWAYSAYHFLSGDDIIIPVLHALVQCMHEWVRKAC